MVIFFFVHKQRNELINVFFVLAKCDCIASLRVFMDAPKYASTGVYVQTTTELVFDLVDRVASTARQVSCYMLNIHQSIGCVFCYDIHCPKAASKT